MTPVYEMNKLFSILAFLLVFSSAAIANGGGDIHDQISRTASGKIYFFDRYNETTLNVQELDVFVAQWIEKSLDPLNIKSKELFKDLKTGIVRLELTHWIDNSEILEENKEITDNITSTAHYSLKFLIHNNKLKVVMDNMFTKHVGVTFDGETFQQTNCIETVYDDLRNFENLVQSKAEELKLEKCKKLKYDIARLQKQIKNLKGKNLDKPRNQKMLARYHQKKTQYDKLNNPKTLKIEIEKDLNEKVDYTQVYQFEKWRIIQASIRNNLNSWDLAEASN